MTKEDLDKLALDFNESRRLPGKRLINDVYLSESDRSSEGEEKKVAKKKTRYSAQTDNQIIDLLKPKRSKPKIELKSKVVEHF
jgi:hypothetical protein